MIDMRICFFIVPFLEYMDWYLKRYFQVHFCSVSLVRTPTGGLTNMVWYMANFPFRNSSAMRVCGVRWFVLQKQEAATDLWFTTLNLSTLCRLKIVQDIKPIWYIMDSIETLPPCACTALDNKFFRTRTALGDSEKHPPISWRVRMKRTSFFKGWACHRVQSAIHVQSATGVFCDEPFNLWGPIKCPP